MGHSRLWILGATMGLLRTSAAAFFPSLPCLHQYCSNLLLSSSVPHFPVCGLLYRFCQPILLDTAWPAGYAHHLEFWQIPDCIETADLSSVSSRGTDTALR
ncbi:hypothetical protein R3P38DRAFT_147926 [Favolaschia claudopus]|uniref:Secreted protein n=1 Tax=Favolaschia claudopus TaxID=2862362 RepID=A0AAV9ZV11_9AGAR